MQESIFDLFGSHNAIVKQQLNPRQATSTSSHLSVPATSNLKQKSASIGGPLTVKRALGDVGNQLQHQLPRSGLSKDEGQKPFSLSCEQKSPSLCLKNRSPLQKQLKNIQSSIKVSTPASKNVVSNQTTLQDKANSPSASDWTSKPEIFPDPDVTQFDDDYEDFFPVKERLTEEDIYRVVTSFGKVEKSQEVLSPPDLISPLSYSDVSEETMQFLYAGDPPDILEEQVSLPDLLWDISANVYEDPLRYTL